MTADYGALEQQYGLPSGLLSAVQQTESGGDPNAVSPAGAVGLFQFEPETAKQYGIDPTDPDQSALGAAKMYSDLLGKYNGDLPSALAAYNWGQGNVDRKGLDKAPEETHNYISKIMGALGNAIVPSAQAAEMPASASNDNPYDSMSDDQLLAEAKKHGIDAIASEPSPQQQVASDVAAEPVTPNTDDPAGLGSKPWSADHIQSEDLAPAGSSPYDSMSDAELLSEAKKQGIPVQDQKLSNAQDALSDQGNKGVKGFLAHETAMGANVIAQVPGLKQLGSALAATFGAGQGNTFGQRYSDLESSQAAMAKAGSESDPTASTLAQIGGNVGGIGLGGELLNGVLPSKATSALSAFAESHPYVANALVGGTYGGLQGLSDGSDSNSPATSGAVGAGLSALASIPLTAAGKTIIEPILGKLVSGASSVLNSGETAPLETDLSKIDLENTPIKQYENIGPDGKAVSDNTTPKYTSIPTADQVKSDSQASYKYAENSGANISSNVTDKVISDAEKTTERDPDVTKNLGNNAAQNFVQKLQGFKGKSLTIQAVDDIDKSLGDEISSQLRSGNNNDARMLQEIQANFRNTIADAGPADIGGGADGFKALSQARQQWMTQMKLRDYERIVNAPDATQASIKNGFKSLYNSAKKIRAYQNNPAEMSALKNAATTGVGTKFIQVVGSHWFPALTGMAGEMAGGPLGAVAGAAAGKGASIAASKVAAAIQSAKAANLAKTIASPYMVAPTSGISTGNLSGVLAPSALQQYLNQGEQ